MRLMIVGSTGRGVGAWGRTFKGMKYGDSWGKRSQLISLASHFQGLLAQPSPSRSAMTSCMDVFLLPCPLWRKWLQAWSGAGSSCRALLADTHLRALSCSSLGLCSKEECLGGLGCLKESCC